MAAAVLGELAHLATAGAGAPLCSAASPNASPTRHTQPPTSYQKSEMSGLLFCSVPGRAGVRAGG